MKFPCSLKNTLLIIRDRFGLSFATKGLGYLAAIYLPLPLLIRYKLSCYQTTCYWQFQCFQKIPCWKPLVISFCSSLGSTLLLIESTTIDPLYLWVINAVDEFNQTNTRGKNRKNINPYNHMWSRSQPAPTHKPTHDATVGKCNRKKIAPTHTQDQYEDA
jgi:hypothetical protein